MKALTLHQPWASLVAMGAKSIETRSWATRHRGPLAIHAARTVADWDRVVEAAAPVFRAFRALHGDERETLWSQPRGVVVATCQLVEVLRIGPYPRATSWECQVIPAGKPAAGWDVIVDGDELAFGDYQPGRWAWLLRDAGALERPIAARGTQRLWDWSPPRSAPAHVHALDEAAPKVIELDRARRPPATSTGPRAS